MKIKKGTAFMLLPKQKRFLEAYVKYEHDYVKAAREAGYTNVQVCRNMVSQNPKAQAYLKMIESTKNEVIAKAFSYSVAESFGELKKAQELALKTTKANVMFRGTKLIHSAAPDLPSFIRAEELKGKLGGLYAPEEKEVKPTTIMNIIRYPGKTGSPTKGKKK